MQIVVRRFDRSLGRIVFIGYAAGNADLVSVIEGLWAQTGPFLAAVVREVEMADDWRRLHGRIAEAIRVRDAAEARALIEKDISWGIEYFNELAEG